MTPLNRLVSACALAFALNAFAASAPAVAKINQVDGHVWRASSLDEKRAWAWPIPSMCTASSRSGAGT
jgi:hypothetical protein